MCDVHVYTMCSVSTMCVSPRPLCVLRAVIALKQLLAFTTVSYSFHTELSSCVKVECVTSCVLPSLISLRVCLCDVKQHSTNSNLSTHIACRLATPSAYVRVCVYVCNVGSSLSMNPLPLGYNLNSQIHGIKFQLQRCKQSQTLQNAGNATCGTG